jgi:hypothetical protein
MAASLRLAWDALGRQAKEYELETSKLKASAAIAGKAPRKGFPWILVFCFATTLIAAVNLMYITQARDQAIADRDGARLEQRRLRSELIKSDREASLCLEERLDDLDDLYDARSELDGFRRRAAILAPYFKSGRLVIVGDGFIRER